MISIPVLFSGTVFSNFDNCAICLDKMTSAKKTLCSLENCTHTFHQYCLRPWMKEHNSCPLCREPIRRSFSARIKKKKCHIEVNQSEKLLIRCRAEHTELSFKQIKLIYKQKKKISIKFISDTGWIITHFMFKNTYQSEHLFNLLCQRLSAASRRHARQHIMP